MPSSWYCLKKYGSIKLCCNKSIEEALRIIGTLLSLISFVSYGYKNSFSSSNMISISSKNKTLRGPFAGASTATSSVVEPKKSF